MSSTKGTWNTGEQIRDHKLATSIINLHGTEDAVFDSHALEELKGFTKARSEATRDQFLAKRGFADDPDTRRGEKAAGQGSLTGYLIARYGTDDPALDERDWELLGDWFSKGMPTGEHVER